MSANNSSGEPSLVLLKEHLSSANKVASRLAWSHRRVSLLAPLDAESVDRLSDEDIERPDAFLYRFNALTALVQDHIIRALLRAEEEDISERSKKDQRLIAEKLSAVKPKLEFGTIAELRNRVVPMYPDDAGKQAHVLNQVFKRSSDLMEIYNDVLIFADTKFFDSKLDLKPVSSAGQTDPKL